jgi:hypothetical protein
MRGRWRRRGGAGDVGTPVPSEGRDRPLAVATESPREPFDWDSDEETPKPPQMFPCVCGFPYELETTTLRASNGSPLCPDCADDPNVCKRCARRAAGDYLHYCRECAGKLGAGPRLRSDRRPWPTIRDELEARPTWDDLMSSRTTASPELEQPIWS